MAVVLSPEMRLLAACCRWPGGADRDAAVRAAADGVDWQVFTMWAARHRVDGLALAALSAAQIQLPAPTARTLIAAAGRIARQNGRLAAESARLQTRLDAAGIAALLVKGAPLAELAYGTQRIKQAKDIDLLVLPQDVAATLALLLADGYALHRPATVLSPRQIADVVRYDREIMLVDRTRKVQLELHWSLVRNRRILAGIDAADTGRPVGVGTGLTVRTLRRDDLFAYLCFHGAMHGWSRLKWIADLAALLAAEPPEERERLHRAAHDRGVGHAAGQALLLAADLLALELPEQLSAALRADRRVRRLVRIALGMIAGPGAEKESGERRFEALHLMYVELMLARGWRDVAANIKGNLVPASDVLQLPLPARLHGLYPLLRLPLAAGRLVRRLRSA